MSGTRRVLPESFKREAVDRVATSGFSVGAVARELGLHETVLRLWMMQFGTQATGVDRRGKRARLAG
jgi:transposase